jgi:hypothetical protein
VSFRRRSRQELERLADRVASAGARLAVLSYPYSSADAESREQRGQVDCVNAVRRAVAVEHGGDYVDLGALLCQGPGRCSMNGTTLRPDGVHFKGPAMPLVADRIGHALGLS